MVVSWIEGSWLVLHYVLVMTKSLATSRLLSRLSCEIFSCKALSSVLCQLEYAKVKCGDSKMRPKGDGTLCQIAWYYMI